MRKLSVLPLLLVLLSCSTIKVATFNNQIGFPNEKNEPAKWSNRLPLVEKMLLEEDFDIVGMQEPMWYQCKDMEKFLTGYAWVGRSVYGPVEDGKYDSKRCQY